MILSHNAVFLAAGAECSFNLDFMNPSEPPYSFAAFPASNGGKCMGNGLWMRITGCTAFALIANNLLAQKIRALTTEEENEETNVW
jgi:hypothetical protein